jgi:hypothetical protein
MVRLCRRSDIVIVADQRLVGAQRGEKNGDRGQCRRIGREACAQGRQVGQLACREIGGQECGEVGLAAALMRQGQQVDHQAAGRFFRDPFEQPVEGLLVGIAREELVAVDETQQRHGLAPQSVDHMAKNVIRSFRWILRRITTFASGRCCPPANGAGQFRLARARAPPAFSPAGSA